MNISQSRAPLLFATSSSSTSSSPAGPAIVFQYRGETPRPARGSARHAVQRPHFSSGSSTSKNVKVVSFGNIRNVVSTPSSSGNHGVPAGSGTGGTAGHAAGGGGGGGSPEVARANSAGVSIQTCGAAPAAGAAPGTVPANNSGRASPRGHRRDSLFVPINPAQAAASGGAIRAAFLLEQQWLPSLPRTPRPRAKRLQQAMWSSGNLLMVTPKSKRSRTPGAVPEPTWSCTYQEDALKRGFAHGLNIGFDPHTPQVTRYGACVLFEKGVLTLFPSQKPKTVF